MKKWILIALLPLLAWAGFAMADAMPGLKAYGAYIKDGDAYVRLTGFDKEDVYFKDVKQAPAVEHESQHPELLIYYPNININNLEVYIHPYKVLASNTLLHPVVEPIAGQQDMYKVTFEETVDSAALMDVIVYDANFRGAINLSDPVPKLIQLYSSDDNVPGSAVYDLDDLIKLYPDVAEFKTLRASWQAKADRVNDDKDYEEVTDLYAKYENSSSLGAKVEFLRQTLNQIQVYRKNHPDGAHLEEAKQLEELVKQKLKI